jgi:F-type H+-transporting ATPase subunit delta
LSQKDRQIEGYAQALFAVADAEGDVERVEDELFRFGKTVEREVGLRDALSDPGLPIDRKQAVVAELLGRASRHTRSLVTFLVGQGKGKELPRIIDALAELAAERRRKALAEVRAAVPLTSDQRKRLAQALSEATGREVELKVLVDPSLLGGVVARVGDQVFDGSIKRKLDLAREQLAGLR